MFPTISEYKEALLDEEMGYATIQNLTPIMDNYGEPYSIAGGFAVVFKMKNTQTGKHYALKCFHKPKPNLIQSYQLISEHLRQYDSPYLVNYQFLPNELELYTDATGTLQTFPCLLMEWVEGKTLRHSLQQAVTNNNKHQLYTLSQNFEQMALWLLQQPFAHTDLKTENIIVTPQNQLVLVDYDGVFVPKMQGQTARETGTIGYCHPKRTAQHYNQHTDDFTILLITLSLRLIYLKPKLYTQTQSDEHLLFTPNDLIFLAKHKQWSSIKTLSIVDNVNSIKPLVELFINSIEDNNCNVIHLHKVLSNLNSVTEFERIIKLLEFFLKEQAFSKTIDRKDYVKNMVLRLYPLNELQVEKYKLEEYHYLKIVSENINFNWTEKFIYKFQNKLDWKLLSKNRSLPWSIGLINKYIDKFDWKLLSQNEGLPWSIELIQKFKDKWDWKKLSANRGLPWSIELIKHFNGKWFSGSKKFDWNNLSENTNIPWSIKLINTFSKKWNWKKLSKNESIKWSIKNRFQNEMSLNRFYEDNLFDFNNEYILNNFTGYDWKQISKIEFINWTPNIISKFKDKWDWYALSCNTGLPWSVELLETYKDKWDWGSVDICEITYSHSYYGLSANKSIPWSKELIIKYIERWNFDALCNNDSIPWNYDLYNRLLPDSPHRIIDNKSVVWSYELFNLLEEDISKLHFQSRDSLNHKLENNSNIFKQLLLPYLDNNLLNIMMNILNLDLDISDVLDLKSNINVTDQEIEDYLKVWGQFVYDNDYR